MTQEERLEYNIRCAEFLGWGFNEISQRWNENMLHDYSFVDNDELKFHSDWNWIMELVEAIGKIKRILISYNHCEIHIYEKDKISICIGRNLTKIAVVEAINQFLIWYKTKKP